MTNDLISRKALMPLFMKKANTMKDRHGVKLGEEWLLNYNDIKDVLDNAPTVEPTFGLFKEMLCSECDKRPQSKWFPIKEEINWGSLHMMRDRYLCGNCGNKSNRITRFCGECGYSMEVQDEQKLRDQSEK